MNCDSQMGEAYRDYVRGIFSIAAESFMLDPSADNWSTLKKAMWAWQHVHQMKAGELIPSAIDHLTSIATKAKGDSNFVEP